MDTTAALAPSLTALRQAELTAGRIRPEAPAALPASGGLRLVPNSGETHAVPSFLRGAAPDLLADGARAGGRLDRQGRLAAKKLLDVLGWEPGSELTAHVRLDRPVVLVRRVPDHGVDTTGRSCDCTRCLEVVAVATELDSDWGEIRATVDVTARGELRLPLGACHAARVPVPGEVVAIAVPTLDAVVLTSAAHALGALVDGLGLAALPEATPDHA